MLEKGLSHARALGAHEAEFAYARDISLKIEVCRGDVETLSRSDASGVGVRVFTPDKRMGFAYGTLNNETTVDAIVDAAWQNAQANDPDEYNGLPAQGAESEDDWAQQDFSGIPTEDKVALARDLERRTLESDARLTFVDCAAYSDSREEFVLVNSNGLRRTFATAACSCYVVGVASQPGLDSEMAAEFDVAQRYEKLRPQWVAGECAAKAVRKLGGTPCKTGLRPVVLDNQVAKQLLTVLGSALSGNQVLKQRSFLAGHEEKSVAAECLSIRDQNDLPEGLNRAPFDAEGLAGCATPLIESGILKSYFHNSYTARKMGRPHTANGVRAGFRSTPTVGATNTYIAPGRLSQRQLCERARDGLFITKIMGIHTADGVSGDFSVGAAGMLIEHGELTRPVRGVTMAGNLLDLLGKTSAVADDLRFFGAYGAPSLLVSELMISGE